MTGVERLAPCGASAARGAGLAALLLLLLQLPACASDLTENGGRFHHGRLGFVVDDPRAAAPEWRLVRVDGAELSFRSPEGAAMSMIVSCDRGNGAPLPLLARQLLIGLEAPDLRESREVTVDGVRAWLQVAEAREAGRPVRLRTVTRPGPPCSVDWVLVGATDPAGRDGEFDRWWASFRAAPDAPAAAAQEARP
jgi:hypothetical protein